ncbi:hypothetical protein SKAU_G00307280 [Synaphobranchus kaupii]|uniref:Methenyltetrahydrofolate synthase domain-containing protein n=1 Tax=Synaphobranchus kaupii TaxID=118154 RepID=A0A9Q1EQV3_SYNKA|nr:hypothetical protein SKAU_G00307280 [Synaphobranchus kaupii]
MEAAIKINSEASKWEIRQKVWDYIEAKNLANFPRPVHNRIPNFKGADHACAHVSNLEIFHRTNEVKVDPDKPLEGARLAVLQAGKTLLVPTPRLRTGLLNKIVPPQGASRQDLRMCSTSQGVKEYSVPIGLDAKITVDLVVVGSVAVSEKGYRIGKGEGYSDMEYAMMASVGAVEDPVVVSIVHDCQVMDIPENLIESHDLAVDYILTPTRVIETKCIHPKPRGIIWAKLDTDMLEKIPILKKLRSLERRAGKDVTLGAGGVGWKRSRGGAGQGGERGPRPRAEALRAGGDRHCVPGRHPLGAPRQRAEEHSEGARSRAAEAKLAGGTAQGLPGLQRRAGRGGRPAGPGGPVRKREECTGRAGQDSEGWQEKKRPARTATEPRRRERKPGLRLAPLRKHAPPPVCCRCFAVMTHRKGRG